MAEKYDFRNRMLPLHPSGITNDAVWRSLTGCRIDDSWEILVPASASRLLQYAGRDLRDFFDTALSVYPRLRKTGNVRAELKSPEKKIVICTAQDYPCEFKSLQKMAYHVTVTAQSVFICGKTDRGAAQGVYHVEDDLRQNEGPVVTLEDCERAPLFSPRMTHSGYELDTFPDAYLQAVAHAGMDAIIVYACDVNTCLHGAPDPDALWPGSGHGYCDFNNLVARAEGYGLDVYVYSHYKCDKHPDDEGAREYYENSFGRLFAHCPGLKGIIFVGETFEFPSRDPHTCGKRCQLRTPADKGSNVGWYPCSDYPKLVRMVKDVICAHNPEADIVFWSYNWGFKPKEPRLELIRNLPRGISLLVTFDMFEHFHGENGAEYTVDDYSISFEGPGQYYVSEAEEAKRLGIRLYAMANTGGRTWDMGVAPYLPVPQQWNRRYRALVESHAKHDLAGLMESHHYGWLPSFVAELAKNAFFTNGFELDDAMERIARRDYAAGAQDALAAWHCFSEGIRSVIAWATDQYGPFRIGPTYPLVWDQTGVTIPGVWYATHSGNAIAFPVYSEDVFRAPAQTELRLMRAKKVCRLFSEGNRHMEQAMQSLTGAKRERAMQQFAVSKFMEHTYRTTVHVKQWQILKTLLQNLRNNAEKNRTADTEPLWKWASDLTHSRDEVSLADAMRKIATEEIENTKMALICYETDTSIGFEASMEYQFDPEHAAWKIAVTEESLRRLGAFVGGG